MNHMISPEAQAQVAEGFGEAPVNLKACALTKNKNHCDEFHADDESWWNDVYYWTTPDRGLRRRGRHLQDPGGLGERLDGDPRLSGGLRPGS